MKSERHSAEIEKSQEDHSPHRQVPRRRKYTVPRSWRNTVLAVLIIYLLHSLAKAGQHIYNSNLRLRPTDYSNLISGAADSIPQPEHPVRHGNGTHIDERYVFMRKLGHGAEGEASVYVDTEIGDLVVVKTYYGHRGSDIPHALQPLFQDFTNKWRNEIEASLLFSHWSEDEMRRFFVEVRDYFILQSQSDHDWHWALVTPFISGGTLNNLANRVRKDSRTLFGLDNIYRPVLHSMLKLLSNMHEEGFCHDDIKPDNIFVAVSVPKHWLLGDLGQVRHVGHDMHTSKGWRVRNQWTDCRLNDVRRLLKTYMLFLKAASNDQAEFDRAFVEGSEIWSAMYWQWMRMPMSAQETITLSKEIGAESLNHNAQAKSKQGACLTRMVERELTCTRLHDQWRDYWLFATC